MSLRRLNNSPYWIACFTLPDGRRTNRSTKTSDRRLAQRLADEWQAAATKARQGQFVEMQARRVLNDILAQVGSDSLSKETVESFLRQWLTGKASEGTAQRYTATVERFLDHLETKRHAVVSAIGHQDILGFIADREQAGVAPKTLSVDVRILHAAFNVARKLGLADVNPVERARAIRPITVESSQRECFSPEQMTSLLSTADGDLKTLVLLGFYTGARLSDAANLRWENIDLNFGVVAYLPRKTQRKGKRIVVPIHPQLLAHLRTLALSNGSEGFLCPSLAGKSTCGKNGLSTRFKRLMAKAGIDGQAGPGLGCRRFAKLSFHSLRHSFNSALANAGVAQETRMKLTGHCSVAVNGDYTHLEVPRLRLAVEQLPHLC